MPSRRLSSLWLITRGKKDRKVDEEGVDNNKEEKKGKTRSQGASSESLFNAWEGRWEVGDGRVSQLGYKGEQTITS